MKKQYKPVPDVEELKYHGTPEKPDIKIFVSHRIDLDSETIDNPLYIPVRCGAVFDERKNITMLGDDTGDNISEKRESFCELTVLYWAWKNIKADYYGLCHYKRYLSFCNQEFETDTQGIVHEPCMGSQIFNRYLLTDENLMRGNIGKVDAVIQKEFDTTNHPTYDPSRNVYRYWKEHSEREHYIDYSSFELLIDEINAQYPDYSDIANQYLQGQRFLGYHCFIMKRELFNALCEFLFSILFEIEKKLKCDHYSENKKRTIGYLSETLYSIWIYKNIIKKKKKYISRQLVLFEDATTNKIMPHFGAATIPIVVVSSAYYAAFSSAFLQSVIEATRASKRKYEIIYLHCEIDKNAQSMLTRMVEPYDNLYISFFNPLGILDVSRFFVSSPVYAKEAYFKLFAPWLLQNYTKALVTDIDLLFMNDPAELFDMDLSDNPIAAVRDIVWQGIINLNPHIMDYAKNELSLSDPYNYVNSGVMVCDFSMIREKFLYDQILQVSNVKKFLFQEQDIINYIFDGNIKFIDMTWNCYTEANADTVMCIHNAPSESFQEYKAIHNAPNVIHYAAQPKPWFEPIIVHGNYYWNYARKTPFYEILLVRLIDSRQQVHNQPLNSRNSETVIQQDGRSSVRKVADKLLPLGSKRRAVVKWFVPRNSPQWRFLKQILYLFHPEYRPKKA